MPVFPPTDLNNLISGAVSNGAATSLGSSLSGVRQLNQSDTGNTILRSSHQASRTFDIGALRPRGLFYVVFNRAGAVEPWQRDIGFLVKSLDQPKVQPKTEELNQYNKKRQIYTGYELSPVAISIYDTADSTVTKMWSQYTKFFFGDFKQTADNFSFDQLGHNMLGDDIGYGLVLPENNAADEQNSQFFFDTIDIYKVFAQEYTKTTLVRPRISSFDPDDLDYSQMEALTFRMSFVYEAVLYANDGATLPISGDPHLSAIFSDPRGDADVITVSGPSRHSTTTGSVVNPGAFPAGLISQNVSQNGIDISPRSAKSGIGGVLGAFGNFNFGSLAGSVVNRVVSGRGFSGTGADLAFSATGNPALSTILGMVTSGRPAGEIASQALFTLNRSNTGMSPAFYDAGQAAVAAVGGNRFAAGKMTQQLVAGVLGGAALTGTTPRQQVSGSGGLNLSDATLSLVNSQRSGGSQIGFNDQSSEDDSLDI
jgi:hypothetical protein